MAAEFFKCFHDYYERTAKLSDQELGRLFRALMLYSRSSVEPEQLAGREAVAFEFIRYDIDRERRKYDEKVARMTEVGRKGGRPKKNQEDSDEPSITQENLKVSKGFCETQEQEQEQEKEIIKKKSATFSPPTPDEVREYAEETGHPGFDAERFCDYYTSKGWKVGKNASMKDWRAAVRLWLRNDGGTDSRPSYRQTYSDDWKNGG